MLFVKRQQIIDAHNLYVAKIIIDNIFTIDYDIKRFRNDHKLQLPQLPHQMSRTQSTKVTWLSQYLNLKLHRQTCQFTRSSSNSYTFKSEFRTVVRLGLNNILKDRIHADIIFVKFSSVVILCSRKVKCDQWGSFANRALSASVLQIFCFGCKLEVAKKTTAQSHNKGAVLWHWLGTEFVDKRGYLLGKYNVHVFLYLRFA